MSEHKRGINPWWISSVLGVVAILFSVFAVQQENDLDAAHATIKELRSQVKDAQERAAAAEARAAESAAEAHRQSALAEEALLQMQENSKKQKRSK